MDIDLLAKMVKKLILDSDKVVLPGLGCFVAEVVPATFSDRGYTINPPYRKLYFRSKPDEGDELVAFYAQTNDLPYDVAEEVIKDFLSEMKSVLFIRKTVIFPGLGRLRATKENDIFFVADEDLDIYPGGFGLEPISLKSHKESKEEVSAVVSNLKSMVDEPAPVPTPEPVPAPEPVPVPEPEPAIKPTPAPEPAPAPASVPVPEPVSPEPVPVQMPETESEKKWLKYLETAAEKVVDFTASAWNWMMSPKRRKVVVCVLGVLAALVVFCLIFAIMVNLFPSLMDTLLYSNEELQILNQIYE